jgi:hypothetical protein
MPGFERCSRLHRKRQHLQTSQPILIAILHALYTPVLYVWTIHQKASLWLSSSHNAVVRSTGCTRAGNCSAPAPLIATPACHSLLHQNPSHNSCRAQMSWQFLDIKYVKNLWSDIQAYAF